ncbi:MAG: DnaJ domain-containing protein [Sulfobacillus sp.]
MISAFPLQWPEGWPRAKSREHARFHSTERKYSSTPGGSSYNIKKDLSVADALERGLSELQKLGIKRDDIVISTNLETRLDGLPRSNQSNPHDPGASVYWQTKKSGMKVLAVDRFYRVADNLAAIAGTLAALRSIERWGGGQILDRAFTGFAALPAPGTKPDWRQVLGVAPHESDPDKIKAAYRIAASRAHPDKEGGSNDRMAEINRAWAEAQRAI